MNNDVLKKIQILRKEFFHKIPLKVAEIESTWKKISAKFEQNDLIDFHRLIHSFHGTAGTYGYASLSKKLGELEAIIKCLFDQNHLTQLQKKEIEIAIQNIKDTSILEVLDESSDSVETQKKILKISFCNFSSAKQENIAHILFEYQYELDVIDKDNFYKINADYKTDFLLVDIKNLSENEMISIQQYKKTHGVILLIFGELGDLSQRLSSVHMQADLFLDISSDPSEIFDLISQYSIFQEGEKFRILVLDDTKSLADYYALLLEQAGMIVSVETNPLNLLRVLGEFEPHLVLMDLYMPYCSGLELTSVLRQTYQYFNLPIIFISTENDQTKQLAALTSAGGDIFLTKPIQPDNLIQAVRLRLKRSVIQNWQIKKDTLTGLYSHAYALEILDHEYSRAARDNLPLSFAMIDIDFFKKINDTYGHVMGDMLLKQLASFLKNHFRKTDTIGRYGGEEFCVTFHNTTLENAKALCNDLLKKIENLIFKNEKIQIQITVSIGLSGFPGASSAHQLIKIADEALYQAKNNGRDQVCVLNSESKKDIQKYLNVDYGALNKAILDSSTYLIVATDLNGVVLDFNRAAESALQYSASEIVGKTTPEIWHDREEVTQRAVELSNELHRVVKPGFDVFVTKLLTQESINSDWNFIRKDGSVFRGNLTATVVRNQNGILLGYLGVIADLTEKIKEIDEKKNLLERLSLAVQSVKMGIWDWNIETNQIIWDTRMYELYDLPETQVITYETWANSLSPAGAETTKKILQDAVNGVHDFNTEFDIILRDGSLRTIQANANLQRDASGKSIRMTGVNWDVTEKRKAEIAKNDFISIVSHELRTPLTAICGAISLLKTDEITCSENKKNELLKIASANSERLLQLINDILDFEKISSGKISLELKKEEISMLIKRSMMLNSEYMRNYHVDVFFDNQCLNASCYVNVDPGRLLQVFGNLLSNAAKFSYPNTQVTISVCQSENRIVISVTNEGAGIPMELQPKIFERFFQVDSPIVRKRGGTGLGLSISKNLVEMMHGTLTFESEPNKKTTFYVTLPIA